MFLMLRTYHWHSCDIELIAYNMPLLVIETIPHCKIIKLKKEKCNYQTAEFYIKSKTRKIYPKIKLCNPGQFAAF